jgi:molecular chaperone GrpE
MSQNPPENDPLEVIDEAELPDTGEFSAADERAPEQPSDPIDPFLALQAKAAEWEDRAKRERAELENYRKRAAREKAEGLRYANRNLLSDLIPIIDNFDMGLQAATKAAEDSVIAQGMRMVFKQIQDFLESNGVKEVEATGKVFDPNQHEAVSAIPSAEVPEGDIIQVLRKGYRLHDQLLRAATVIVSKGPETPAGEEEAPSV